MVVDTQASSQRIVILSDTHLGRPSAAARSAAALRPLWEGATRLIVNGDVAEVHHPDHWSGAARQTLHLHDLCEADDVALTLLAGNHDPYISDIRYLRLCDEQVFVTHGDALHPAVAPWSPVAGRIRAAYEHAMQAMREDDRGHLEQRLMAAQHAAAHIELEKLANEAGRSSIRGMLLRPWAVLQVLYYWRVFPRLAERFMMSHKEPARFAVFGHTHRPGIWRINERVIINTGSFGFPGSPFAVVLEANHLTVWPILLRGDTYRFSETPKAQFALQSKTVRSLAVDGEDSPRQHAAEHA